MKIGLAFSDHIKTERVYKKHDDPEKQRGMRYWVLLFLLVIFTGVILSKIIDLQIFNGNYYRTLSDSNRTRTKIIHAPRGIIFDRTGTPLVYNIPGFREVNGEKTRLLTREKAIELLAKGSDKLEIDSLRYYPLKEATSHVIGYVGQITLEEISQPVFAEYSPTERIGKTGIEQSFEYQLRGTDGKELIEVDALGRKVRTLGQTEPIPGKDITTNIDAKLQKVAYDSLSDSAKGAILATTPDGEVLAMVSKPSFDTNLFTMDNTYIASRSSYKNVSAILEDGEGQPLMNRTISGVYPPGSTFKIVTAASALEEKLVNKNYYVEDTGILRVGEFSFGNWFYLEQGKTDGKVNVVSGLSRSNDIYFYKVAELLNVDRLSKHAALFGVGKKSGIQLKGEMSGLLPTRKWKKTNLNEDWYLGDTYHYGIGQGYLLTTPMQVNLWTQAIANGGSIYKPQILKNSQPEVIKTGLLSQESLGLIRQGMIDSCNPGGVAWPLFEFRVKSASRRTKLEIDGKNFLQATTATNSANRNDVRVSIACKTGTAQHGGEETLPHAWITLFAPAYNPEIVITVLVESSGQGSNIAAPVAKKMLEEWFSR